MTVSAPSHCYLVGDIIRLSGRKMVVVSVGNGSFGVGKIGGDGNRRERRARAAKARRGRGYLCIHHWSCHDSRRG